MPAFIAQVRAAYPAYQALSDEQLKDVVFATQPSNGAFGACARWRYGRGLCADACACSVQDHGVSAGARRGKRFNKAMCAIYCVLFLESLLAPRKCRCSVIGGTVSSYNARIKVQAFTAGLPTITFARRRMAAHVPNEKGGGCSDLKVC